MGAHENSKTIQGLYEAFGRGDVGTILDALTDDVDWATETSSTAAPWYGPRHGKEAVTAFFDAFGSTMEVQEFTPFALAANDSDVFTVVHCQATARSTGKIVQHDLHHYLRFREGKVALYRGTEDTAEVQAALRG